MSDLTERINKNLEKIAMEIVTLEGRDIPVMGNMMNSLCEMEKDSREVDQPSFLELTLALKGYLEKMILDEEDNAEPLEEGIECLQSIYHCLINKKIFNGDLSQIFSKLLYKKPVSEEKIDHQDTGVQIEEDGNAGDEERVSQGEQLDEDDREILEDFIMESKDNLDAIENGLMTLEQSPEDQESINAIFRSFHTIKGVSAFLNLLKINKLAHSAENLLDKARSGEIRVEGSIVDII
ncbi:MAG: Hpt domain-containing protein, partial [Deltaproteobacteria bacterium]|nr:Hpt domain-containing protein [Deltaproteobacteria bacterium]